MCAWLTLTTAVGGLSSSASLTEHHPLPDAIRERITVVSESADIELLQRASEEKQDAPGTASQGNPPSP